MSERVAALELDVAELKGKVSSLSSEFQRVRKPLAALKAERASGSAALGSYSSVGGEAASEDSCSVVSGSVREVEAYPLAVPAPSSNVSRPVTAASGRHGKSRPA